jgi:hypothetical protein
MGTSPNTIIDIYGSSYKSGTKLTEGSQSIVLKEKFEDMGFVVRMIDGDFEYYECKLPSAVIMMSDSINIDITKMDKNCIFVDPWRRYPQAKDYFKSYYAMGVGHA